MIEAGLEFPSWAKKLVVQTFLELPGMLKPDSIKIGENEIGTLIQDSQGFLHNISKHETGFFLNGANVSYDINYAGDKNIICNCFLNVDFQVVRGFLGHMVAAQPLFGFACEAQERDHWNRIKTKQGINSIESWVGRDPQKYVPGLYWWTLLPTALAERHDVSLAAIEEVALEHAEIANGQNLFRFYDKPDDWRSADRVAALRVSQPGIFDVEKVKSLAATTKTFLEMSAVTRAWP